MKGWIIIWSKNYRHHELFFLKKIPSFLLFKFEPFKEPIVLSLSEIWPWIYTKLAFSIFLLACKILFVVCLKVFLQCCLISSYCKCKTQQKGKTKITEITKNTGLPVISKQFARTHSLLILNENCYNISLKLICR